VKTQRARLDSLPDAATLEARLPLALEGLPLRAPRLTPFIDDITRARQRPPLQAADLDQTSMGLALDALLLQRGMQWSALLPLTAPTNGVIDADRMRAALRDAAIPQALFVDLKAESDHLYAGYLQEAIVLSLGGLIAIVALLWAVTRSPLRVMRVIAPLAAAVISVAAGLAILGQPMTLLHLVGLLLVVAVGSNYALFFDHTGDNSSAPRSTTISPRTLASMLIANVTTVAGFGVLAFSKVSILQALGVTVAPGVVLALIYSAIFARADHGR
jgi:predicted exporter